MKVKLIAFTPEPEKVVAASARLCYSPLAIDEILKGLTAEKVEKRIADAVARGHHSVLEHASFTFGIEGISRVTSHQLVRHRLASYSQQSQRYVKFDEKTAYVVPPSIAARDELSKIFRKTFKEALETYQKLVDAGIDREDARYILPNAAETRLTVTMNARELLHFFEIRCCLKAQWEIRMLAASMLKEVKKAAPVIFEKAGAACMKGCCPEGDIDCFNKMKRKFKIKARGN